MRSGAGEVRSRRSSPASAPGELDSVMSNSRSHRPSSGGNFSGSGGSRFPAGPSTVHTPVVTASITIAPASIGPASVGPASIGPASIGPASVAPASAARSNEDPPSAISLPRATGDPAIAAASLAPPGTAAAPRLRVEVLSGPAVGPPHHLGPGSHVVGRAAGADVRLEDPTVEAHHLVVDVDGAGRARVVQITGRCPALVGDRPLDGHAVLHPGQELAIGTTRLRVVSEDPDESTAAVRSDSAVDAAPIPSGSVTVVRSPRAVPAPAVPAIVVPTVDEPSAPAGLHPGMLIGSLAGLVAGVVLAVLTRSPLVLVMGLVAASVSWSTWAVGRVRHVLARRRVHQERIAAGEQARASVKKAAAAIRRHHERCHPPIAQRLSAGPGTGLWERRPHHGDAFTVSLGRGDLERPLPVDVSTLPPGLAALVDAASILGDVDVPVRLDVRDRHVVALSGPGAHGVARSIIVQLATATGPADWVLRAALEHPGEHTWLRRLPHAAVAAGLDAIVPADDPASVSAMVGSLDDGDERRVVLVCDAPSLLTSRIGPVRRLLDRDRPITVLLVDETGGALPAVSGSVLRLSGLGAGWWIEDLGDGGASGAWGEQRLRPAAVPMSVADRIGLRLASCADPELLAASTGGPPRSVDLARLGTAGVLPWTVDEILASWAAGGSDPPPIAVLGVGREPAPGANDRAELDSADVIDLDLVRDGPHGLVAGTTGSGKSELLRTLVVSLAARTDPRLLSFVLVDYKGGATFDACADLPHTVGVVTDLDEGLAERALMSLDAELRRRERILRDHGAADLHAVRSGPDPVSLPRLIVVIDEFAALAKELPGFLAALVDVAQRGRSLGIHLVLATQRPAGVIDDAIRANTNLRIALRLHDAADALDVVGDRSPTTFPRAVPGRAVVRLGPDELVVFQSAACTVQRPGGSVEGRPEGGSSTIDDDAGPDDAGAVDAGAGPVDAGADVADAGPDDAGPDDGGRADTDLAVLVANIREAARRSGFAGSHRPWLPPLDDPSISPPGEGAVGWTDDPAGQCRRPLRWDRTGHLALIGAIGSGTTTALVALAAHCPVVHVIDGRGDRMLGELGRWPNCSGVLGVDDHERIDRLLRRLIVTIDQRRAGRHESPGSPGKPDCPDSPDSAGVPDEVLFIDGYEAVRRSLDEPDRLDPDGVSSPAARLRRILAEGPPVGVLVAAVVEPESGGASLGRFHERWLFHVDDPAIAGLVGVASARIPPSVPGRLTIGSSGLAARIWPPGPTTAGAVLRCVEPVESLPARVTSASLGRRWSGRSRPFGRATPGGSTSDAVIVGQRFDDLGPALFDWATGDPVVIAGPRRSGRTTLLRHLAAAWEQRHPDGRIAAVGAEGLAAPLSGTSVGVGDLAEWAAPSADLGDRPRLVLVDDADRIDDVDGVLTRLVSLRSQRAVTVLIAGRADALRSFDHWSAAARRRRCGFVMAATSELDADVLGLAPPRRNPITPRPGLAWMIAHGDCALVQLLAPCVPDEEP